MVLEMSVGYEILYQVDLNSELCSFAIIVRLTPKTLTRTKEQGVSLVSFGEHGLE